MDILYERKTSSVIGLSILALVVFLIGWFISHLWAWFLGEGFLLVAWIALAVLAFKNPAKYNHALAVGVLLWFSLTWLLASYVSHPEKFDRYLLLFLGAYIATGTLSYRYRLAIISELKKPKTFLGKIVVKLAMMGAATGGILGYYAAKSRGYVGPNELLVYFYISSLIFLVLAMVSTVKKSNLPKRLQ